MSQIDHISSRHYVGDRGKAYFTSKFGSDMELGRLFQSRFFRPYCSDKLTLLDFGCANGLFLRNLPARERIGVEINPHARLACQQLSQDTATEIELHQYLDTVASEQADVVISNHCLEHVEHPLSALLEIKRVLKPGGTLALMVPFDDYRSRQNRKWQTGDQEYHLYTWSPMNLGNLLQVAGFEVSQIDMHTRAWSPKFFWVHRVFGETMFRLCCTAFGYYRKRREVFGRAIKPMQ